MADRKKQPVDLAPDTLTPADGELGKQARAWNASVERHAAPVLLALLDGLKERGLLERAQIVQCDGASVQLGPALFVPPALTPEQEAERDEAKVALPNPDTLLYGASEGV